MGRQDQRAARPLSRVVAWGTAPASASPRARLGGALPALPAAIFGREDELAALRDLVWRADRRLITLLGPGGIGKTTLAIAAADAAANEFTDGVAFVDLSALTAAEAVPLAIVAALGLRGGPRQTGRAVLHEALRDRDLLLVLDNCEQLPGIAQVVHDLLLACPMLVILATSRMALRLRWEQRFQVSPLTLPAPATALADLCASSAVALFLDRAQAVDLSFQLTEANRAALVALCVQLDGLPLAIEMAAAHVGLRSLSALAAYLRERLHLLRSEQADRPARHRTLMATIDWSYERLTPTERAVFRRLAIFAGGCNLAAATAVCQCAAVDGVEGEALPVPDLLAALVEQSLLVVEDDGTGESRYRMLVPIREYALTRLVDSGEAPICRTAHAAYFLELAKRTVPELHGPQQLSWLDTLTHERANFRAVLTWAIAERDGALGLQLGAALWWSWYQRGEFREGCRWLEQVLALPSERMGSDRAACLIGCGTFAYQLGETSQAQQAGEAGLALARELGDSHWLGYALNLLGGLAVWAGDYAAAQTYYGEALEIYRRWQQYPGMTLQQLFAGVLVLANLGTLAVYRGELLAAVQRYEESLALTRRLGDRHGIAHALFRLGEAAEQVRDYPRAVAHLTDAEALFGELGDRWGAAWAQLTLARLLLHNGGVTAAAELLAGAARYCFDAQVKFGQACCWEVAAALAVQRGHAERAAALLGSAATLRATIAAQPTAAERTTIERLAAVCRAILGDGWYAAAWQRGSLRAPEATNAEFFAEVATECEPFATPPVDHPAAQPHVAIVHLTRREQEFLPLLARGLANRGIAEQLSISTRTVEMHIANLLRKLNLGNRAQVAAWAAKEGFADVPLARR